MTAHHVCEACGEVYREEIMDEWDNSENGYWVCLDCIEVMS